jgi:hypothetical protein
VSTETEEEVGNRFIALTDKVIDQNRYGPFARSDRRCGSCGGHTHGNTARNGELAPPHESCPNCFRLLCPTCCRVRVGLMEIGVEIKQNAGARSSPALPE